MPHFNCHLNKETPIITSHDEVGKQVVYLLSVYMNAGTKLYVWNQWRNSAGAPR